MRESFLDKWVHRIRGAWKVLTGQAFAAYYFDDCMQKYWRPDLANLPADFPTLFKDEDANHGN